MLFTTNMINYTKFNAKEYVNKRGYAPLLFTRMKMVMWKLSFNSL